MAIHQLRFHVHVYQKIDVRFTPDRHLQCTSPCLLRAKSGHSDYSITSSAPAIRLAGTVRPRAFAVLRFIANSYFVGGLYWEDRGLLTFPNAWR
jgi:hypothetical protein